MKGLHSVIVFSFGAFGKIARAFNDYDPETLFAVMDAFPAQSIVSDVVAVIEK
jgi:hypothetical protein